MPGPAPAYQPTFAAEEIAPCQRLVRQPTAPQGQVYRATLARLWQEQPALANVSAGKQLGNHEHWVRSWRRIWATEGFRLTDKPGRAQTLALSQLALPPRPAVPGESRPGVGLVRRLVGGPPLAAGRLRPQGR